METCRKLLAGGKLLRPSFCFWGWPAAGGKPGGGDEPSIIGIAAALEGSSRSFGRAAAILLGDICLVWSYELILHRELDAATRSALLEITNLGNQDLMVGQYLDLRMAAQPAESGEDALLVAYFKTTSCTVERPLVIGAKVADPDSPAVAVRRKFAGHAGEACQLRDDVLGVFGDPEVTGKPVGDDLTAGKGSLLLTAARSSATRSQVAEMDRARGQQELSNEHLESCRSIIIETGALDTVEQRIAEQYRRAFEILDSAPELHQAGKNGLCHLLELLVDRAS